MTRSSSTTDGFFSTAAVVIGSAVLVALLAVGGHFLGWWFAADSADRQAEVNRSSSGTQEAHRTALQNKIAEIAKIDVVLADPRLEAEQRSAIASQRVAIVDTACLSASKIEGAHVNSSWVTTNCS